MRRLNWFNWSQAREDEAGLSRFHRQLIRLRRGKPELQVCRERVCRGVRAPWKLELQVCAAKHSRVRERGRCAVARCSAQRARPE